MRSSHFAYSLSLSLWIAYLGACGSGSSDVDPAITHFCQRMIVCSGQPSSEELMEQCRLLAAMALQIVPDPASFAACIDGLSCSQLEEDQAVKECLDLDSDRIECRADALFACTHKGVCRTIDCHSTCGLLGATFDHCGHDAEKGYSVCWCRI